MECSVSNNKGHMGRMLLPYSPENSTTSITTRPRIQGEKIDIEFALSVHKCYANLVYNANFCWTKSHITRRCFRDYTVFNFALCTERACNFPTAGMRRSRNKVIMYHRMVEWRLESRKPYPFVHFKFSSRIFQ